MKKTLLRLTLALGLTIPLSVQANPAPLTAVPSHPKTRARGVVPPRHDDRTVYYYITDNYSTGSHIPMVVRRYRGRNEVLGGGFRTKSVYDAGDIGATGATSVGAALRRLDPSFL